jgi:hypothetical protein
LRRSSFIATCLYYFGAHHFQLLSRPEATGLVLALIVGHSLLSDLTGRPCDYTAPVFALLHRLTNIPEPLVPAVDHHHHHHGHGHGHHAGEHGAQTPRAAARAAASTPLPPASPGAEERASEAASLEDSALEQLSPERLLAEGGKLAKRGGGGGGTRRRRKRGAR